jgi:uncharacterized protein
MDLNLVNAAGERLSHTFTPGKAGRRALVIVTHGVTSQHDRPYLNELAAGLAARGLAALQVSYAGNGQSEGSFEKCTISKEVADLGSVLDALEGWTVGYTGHSMGGAVGVLRAAQDPRIRALCSLAGMVRVEQFMERTFGHLSPGEALLGKAKCPLSQVFLDDARKIESTLDAARKVHVPWLLVHGTADELVPHSDSEEVCAVNSGARLELLHGADHRFAGHVPKMVALVSSFFDTAL